MIEISINNVKKSYGFKNILNGINIASLNAEYCDNVEEELDKISVNEVGADMDDVIKYFNDVNEKLKDKMYTEKADELFSCVPMKMEQFYDKFAKECMNVPIFKYYDAFQMLHHVYNRLIH